MQFFLKDQEIYQLIKNLDKKNPLWLFLFIFLCLIFGNGIGSYGILSQGIDARKYPHNIFLESWFENEGSWNDKDVRMRVTNISHYIQTKHENANKFRLVSEDSCNCDS